MNNKQHETITLPSTKRVNKMAESKVFLWILDLLIIPLYTFTWFSNLDNIKSTLLFGVALGMAMVRFYYWVVRAKQNKILKDLDIEERKKNLSRN